MMKNLMIAISLMILLLNGGTNPSLADAAKNEVQITAKQFKFVPNEIALKKGVPVVLELSTADVAHGFTIPALNVRADIKPGKVTELSITPTKAGDMVFYCDNFCGEGHDDMNGKFKVTE